MKKIDISTLIPGTIAEGNVYTESGELLVSKGVTISRRHIDVMARRNIFDVYVKNFEDEELGSILTKEFKKLDDLAVDSKQDHVTLKREENAEPEALKLPMLKNIQRGEKGAIHLMTAPRALELDDILKKGSALDRPLGPALSQKAVQIPVSERTESYKNDISITYSDAVDQTRAILSALSNAHRTEETRMRQLVGRFIKTFLTDRSILLNISNIKPDEGEYLFHHALNVCLLAINIAAAAKYSERQILEIGLGALLHDSGMMLVPPDIRFKKGRLSRDEFFEVQKHAILGLHLVEKIAKLPEPVQFVTYQTHERENGKGYPKQRSGRLIHSYAKIVQIADVYESLCSPRDYRPPYLPYRAMEILIKMSRSNLVSPEFVKAFLEYASLFPVGSIVELSDHRIARVVAANGVHFTKPQVSVILDAKGNVLSRTNIHQIDLSADTGVQIVRALEPTQMPQTIDIMHGF
jgi:HD-GYP domain-containing protein (c-di-GMP phosphodiesterase class II)